MQSSASRSGFARVLRKLVPALAATTLSLAATSSFAADA